MARRENRYQSRPSQRYLYLIANAHRIAYRPGGQGHVLDLFAPPRFSVPAGAGPCFHHRHQLVFSWVLVLHLVDGERANLKALARHGPAHLAYQHYRCQLRIGTAPPILVDPFSLGIAAVACPPGGVFDVPPGGTTGDCRCLYGPVPLPGTGRGGYVRDTCNPTTSFESALGLSPLFVREIRPMMTLLNLGDQLQHISPRILA
jgi:hypothetical protein